MVKCVKVYLNYIDGQPLSYKEFCNAAWSIQRDVRAAKNKAVSELYENIKWKMGRKEQDGAYPDDTERYGQKLGQHIYSLLCQNAPDLQTANIATIQQSLSGKFRKDAKEILKGEKSIPSFKGDQPIELHNNSVKLVDCGDHVEVSISIFSTEKRKELGLKNGVVSFSVFRPGDSVQAILLRCANGMYKHGAGRLKYDRKKKMWVLSLSYHFDAEEHALDPDRICGVDLGIAAPVYCAVSDGYDRLSFPGGAIERFRRRVEKQRRGLLKSRPFCGNGSRGRGYKTRVRPVEVTSGKIASFRNLQNDLMSRAVVDFAVKHQCGEIRMENLSGIGAQSTFLKNWSYYDLQQKISNKAAGEGIKVVKINPRYTSQRCHKCGHISRANRKSQAYFECEACGYKTNADFNAAKNIATKGIEKTILKSLGANPEPTEVS